LWAWGHNAEGQLGDGTNSQRNTPVEVGGGSTDWKTVAAGRQHSLAIKNDGTLYTWGYGAQGQLGLGSNLTNRSGANQITGVSGVANNAWKAVFAYGYNSYAIDNQNHLFAWGQNDQGQLGIGTTGGNINIPTPVFGTNLGVAGDWATIGAGFYHVVGIKTNGSLWTWGTDVDGQLGNGATTGNVNKPTQIDAGGANAADPNSWKMAATGGGEHQSWFGMSYAIKNDGSLWAWGRNNLGMLGDGTTLNKLVPTRITPESDWNSVTAGYSSAAAIKTDGTLWTWGTAGVGELVNGSWWLPNYAPKQIGKNTNWTYVDVKGMSGGNSIFALSTPAGVPITPTMLGDCALYPATPTTITIGNNYGCEFTITGIGPFIVPPEGLYLRTNQGTNNSPTSSTCIVTGATNSTLRCTGISSGTTATNFITGTGNVQVGIGAAVGTAPATYNNKGTVALQIPTTVVNPPDLDPSPDCIVSKSIYIQDKYDCSFPLTGTLPFAMPSAGSVYARTKQTGGNSSPTICVINTTTNALDCKNIKTDGTLIAGVAGVELGVTATATTWHKKGDVTLLPASVIIDNTFSNTNVANCTPTPTSVTLDSTFTCTFALSGSGNNKYEFTPNTTTVAQVTGATDSSGACSIANNGSTGAVIQCTLIPTAGTTIGTKDIKLQMDTAAAVTKGTVQVVQELTPADIADLTASCTSTTVNSVTDCTFTLPTDKTLPSDFKLSIGSGAVNAGGTIPDQICAPENGGVSLLIIKCTNVPTGNSVGNIPIYAQLAGTTGSITATGETVTITGVNFAALDWVFNPDQGGTSPLFRSSDNTTITVKNLRTVFDQTPSVDTRYTCVFEYRAFNDRLATTPTWTTLNSTPIPYITGTGATSGCNVNLTKTQRANALNHPLRLSITDTTLPSGTACPIVLPSGTHECSNTYTFYNEYIYRFQGAGTASGA